MTPHVYGAKEATMPRKPDDHRGSKREDAPQTDLPPTKDPYYDGYFGTDEEEGVVRERDDSGDAGPSREAAEDAAGGDREI
jgi:hypothetical protein